MFMTKNKKEHLELAAKVKFLEYDRLHGSDGFFEKVLDYDVRMHRPITTLIYSYPTFDNHIEEVTLSTYEHYDFVQYAERKFKYTRLVSLRTASGVVLHFSLNCQHGTMVRVEAEEIQEPTEWKDIGEGNSYVL